MNTLDFVFYKRIELVLENLIEGLTRLILVPSEVQVVGNPGKNGMKFDIVTLQVKVLPE